MGWFDKISNWGSKAFGHVKDFLGGKKSGFVGKLVNHANSIIPGSGDYLHQTGRDAFQSVLDRGMNATFDGINKFSNSDLIKQKMPILSGAATSAADALRERLQQGYTDLTGKTMAGMQPRRQGDVPMDGIER